MTLLSNSYKFLSKVGGLFRSLPLSLWDNPLLFHITIPHKSNKDLWGIVSFVRPDKRGAYLRFLDFLPFFAAFLPLPDAEADLPEDFARLFAFFLPKRSGVKPRWLCSTLRAAPD